MSNIKQLKSSIQEMDKELKDLNISELERVRIRASRNSKARIYNANKSFYQREIKLEY